MNLPRNSESESRDAIPPPPKWLLGATFIIMFTAAIAKRAGETLDTASPPAKPVAEARRLMLPNGAMVPPIIQSSSKIRAAVTPEKQ